MSTSVKMSEEGKRVLDALQARLVLALGKRISQQELLDVLVKFLAEREDELVRLLGEIKLPLPSEEVEKLMRLPTDWGVETREEEIDVYLYGEKGRRV
jgi:hypothetical protein